VKHKSPPTLIAEMDRRFRLSESVLRHLTVMAPKELPASEIPAGAGVPAVSSVVED